MAKNTIQSVRGTRDFYPKEMSYRHWFKSALRRSAELFGYSEYEGPILERLELYAAKSGDELVKEQAFVFQDRGGEEVVLRPELTPSLARMVAAKSMGLPKPIRWWSFGPMWRYERPQKGRSREFFQWNVDMLGVDTPEADAEIIALAATFFKDVGLSSAQVKIDINDRTHLDESLSRLGISNEQLSPAKKAIDRIHKLPTDKWCEYIQQSAGISSKTTEEVLKLLDDSELWRESQRLSAVFGALSALGVAEYVRYNPRIVRGLDYYTGTVFEATDIEGEFRAILGGGRYGNLVEDVGGSEPLSGVGFGMGDMVIELVLQKFGVIPTLKEKATKALILCFSEELYPDSAALASKLRAAGISIELAPGFYGKLNKQLKYASDSDIRYAIIMGPTEKEDGVAQLKDLSSGTQTQIPLDSIIHELSRAP